MNVDPNAAIALSLMPQNMKETGGNLESLIV